MASRKSFLPSILACFVAFIGGVTAFPEAFGATLTVSKDGSAEFYSVEEALKASVAGDTVLVLPGVYAETATIEKDVILQSALGPEATALLGVGSIDPVRTEVRGFHIEGGFSGLRFVDVVSVVIEDCVVVGFDRPSRFIRNGYSEIRACVFEENHAKHIGQNLGGGAVVVQATPPSSTTAFVVDSVFKSNSTMFGQSGGGFGGGGALAATGNVEIRGCLFDSNRAITGGAVFAVGGPRIVNNTFVRNDAEDAVVFCDLGPDGRLYNCLFANNESAAVMTLGVDLCECNALWNNRGYVFGACVWNPARGNLIDVDPMFCEGDGWKLSPESPFRNPSELEGHENCESVLGASEAPCMTSPVLRRGWGDLKRAFGSN